MILLLAGTTEAQALALSLAEAGIPALASLAGATVDPRPYPIPTRLGGFGGAEGFLRQVTLRGVRAVVDATHPYAARITDRTARLCAELGLPYLRLQRPGWQGSPGDQWHWVDDAGEVTDLIPQEATVFLTTGRQSLPDFSGLKARRVLVRVVDPQPEPPAIPGGEWIVQRGPFDVAAEVAMMRAEGVTWVVSKDAGGQGARAKLDAARQLGLPVAMIRRPKGPDAPTVASVDAALKWVRGL